MFRAGGQTYIYMALASIGDAVISRTEVPMKLIKQLRIDSLG